MLYLTTAAAACALALASASAQTAPYTAKSLKTAIATASTPQDYNKLATYYAERSTHFHQLAEEHGNTLKQELEHPTPGTKYPTAVDRARRLQEYYLDQSHKAHTQSEHYKSLAEKAPTTQAAQ